jgi:hypothetical protein
VWLYQSWRHGSTDLLLLLLLLLLLSGQQDPAMFHAGNELLAVTSAVVVHC